MKKTVFLFAVCAVFILRADETVNYGPGFRDVRLGEKLDVVLSKYRDRIRRRIDHAKTGEMDLMAVFENQNVTFTFLSENPEVTSELMRSSDDRLMPDFRNAKLVAVKIVFPNVDFPIDPVRQKIEKAAKQPPVEKRTRIRYRLCLNGYVLHGYYVDIDENRTVYTDGETGCETAVVSFGAPSVSIVDKEVDPDTKNRVARGGYVYFDPNEFIKTFYTVTVSDCQLLGCKYEHELYDLPKANKGMGKPYPHLPFVTRRSATLTKQIGDARKNAGDKAARQKAEEERKKNAAKVNSALDF